MCIVDLNRSTLSCGHLWYHLIESCAPDTGLEDCKGKIVVTGWEIKSDFCPFCAEWPISDSEFKLLGGPRRSSTNNTARHYSVSSSGSSSSGRSTFLMDTESTPKSQSSSDGFWSLKSGNQKRRPSIMSVSSARQLSRNGELGGVAESLYDMSPVLSASEQNEHMNILVEAYTEGSLDSIVLRNSDSRESSKESSKEYSKEVSKERENMEESSPTGWKRRSSKRFSDMFRRAG